MLDKLRPICLLVAFLCLVAVLALQLVEAKAYGLF